MPTNITNLESIRDYYSQKLNQHGPTSRGMDYNSVEAQEIRFAQISKIINSSQPYSLMDFGSGYGALYDYLKRMGHPLTYYGYDILEDTLLHGRALHPNDARCIFTANYEELPPVDYAVVSGTFNIKLDISNEEWLQHVLESLHKMNRVAQKGFSSNFLTIYSDPEYMRPDLYYADPCFLFDYCKRNFSRNVAILHDYGIYDFTILVRKSG